MGRCWEDAYASLLLLRFLVCETDVWEISDIFSVGGKVKNLPHLPKWLREVAPSVAPQLFAPKVPENIFVDSVVSLLSVRVQSELKLCNTSKQLNWVWFWRWISVDCPLSRRWNTVQLNMNLPRQLVAIPGRANHSFEKGLAIIIGTLLWIYATLYPENSSLWKRQGTSELATSRTIENR